jgi:uncharacterized protein
MEPKRNPRTNPGFDDLFPTPFLRELARIVRERLGTHVNCHDFAHTTRVLHNARLLLKFEEEHDVPIQRDVIEAAAVLHDIARPEETASNGTCCHALLGAKMVPDLLATAGRKDEDFVNRVMRAVQRHRYRGSEPPVTIEEKIVFDADKLDSVGAVGIARALHFAGHVGAKLHNREEEAMASAAYSEEDSAYREYLVKLRWIPQRMLTEPGRAVAVRRVAFMEIFFNQMNIEIFGSLNDENALEEEKHKP